MRHSLAVLLALLAPRLAAALHGEEFATKLAATPHEVVDFRGKQQHSPPTLRLEVHTHGHELIIALEKHDTLFAPHFAHIIIHPNGSVLSREGHGPNGHCIYRGHLFNASSTAPIGDALVSVCDGKIEGRLRIGATHDLVVAPHPAKDGRHAVFQRADFDEDGFECGVGDDEGSAAAVSHEHRHHHYHHDHDDDHDVGGHPEHDDDDDRAMGDHRHDVDEATQRRRLITGNVKKYVELLIVNDKAHCDLFTDAGETLSDMTTRSAAIVAFMTALYNSGFTGVRHRTRCALLRVLHERFLSCVARALRHDGVRDAARVSLAAHPPSAGGASALAHRTAAALHPLHFALPAYFPPPPPHFFF